MAFFIFPRILDSSLDDAVSVAGMQKKRRKIKLRKMRGKQVWFAVWFPLQGIAKNQYYSQWVGQHKFNWHFFFFILLSSWNLLFVLLFAQNKYCKMHEFKYQNMKMKKGNVSIDMFLFCFVLFDLFINCDSRRDGEFAASNSKGFQHCKTHGN